jgi:hypothetical protein
LINQTDLFPGHTCPEECLYEPHDFGGFCQCNVAGRDGSYDIRDRLLRVTWPFKLSNLKLNGLLAAERESMLKAKPDGIDVTLPRQLRGFLGNRLELPIQENLRRDGRTISGARGATCWVP